MDPVRQILEDDQTEGSEFSVAEPRAFILLSDHAGGEWKLQVRNPEGDWVDIADGSGGVSFEDNGLVFFYAQGWLNYRLNGGSEGAKAWLLSGEVNPGLK